MKPTPAQIEAILRDKIRLVTGTDFDGEFFCRVKDGCIEAMAAEIAALTAAAEVGPLNNLIDDPNSASGKRTAAKVAIPKYGAWGDLAAAEVGEPNVIEQPKWPCTYPDCTCGSIKTDCVRFTIERCAQALADYWKIAPYSPLEDLLAAIRKLKDER